MSDDEGCNPVRRPGRPARTPAPIQRLGVIPNRQEWSDADDERLVASGARGRARVDDTEYRGGEYRGRGRGRGRGCQNIPEAPDPHGPPRPDPSPPHSPPPERRHRGPDATPPDTRSPPRQEGIEHGAQPVIEQYPPRNRIGHTSPGNNLPRLANAPDMSHNPRGDGRQGGTPPHGPPQGPGANMNGGQGGTPPHQQQGAGVNSPPSVGGTPPHANLNEGQGGTPPHGRRQGAGANLHEEQASSPPGGYFAQGGGPAPLDGHVQPPPITEDRALTTPERAAAARQQGINPRDPHGLYLDQFGGQLNMRHIPPQEGEAAPPGANARAGGPQQGIEALSPAHLRTRADGGPGEKRPPPAGTQHLHNPLLAQGGPPLAPGENMPPPAGAQQPPYYPARTRAVDRNAQEGTTGFGTILQRN